MIRIYLLVCVLLSTGIIKAQSRQSDSIVKKTGWLIYHEQQVFWAEAPLNKTVKHRDFFDVAVYKNVLRMGGSYKAMYFGFLAKEFPNDYHRNIKVVTAEDSSLRYFWLLPVVAEVKYRPQSELHEDENETPFLTSTKKVVLRNKWERNYIIGDFDFLRKEDSLKAAKHLAKLKVKPDEYYGQKGAW